MFDVKNSISPHLEILIYLKLPLPTIFKCHEMKRRPNFLNIFSGIKLVRTSEIRNVLFFFSI